MPRVLTLPRSVKIYLASKPTDMRRGFDGLSAMVLARGQDVYSGHLFVFVSRRGDRIKILSWDRGGFVLWYKRLEKGRFRVPPIEAETEAAELDSGQLAMLLDGIDFSRVRRPPVWEPPESSAWGIDKSVPM